MIVTAHQPNFLPGASVVGKIAQADAVIWLDEVQFSHGGWSNRNRMPDGSWLTVPIERTTDMAPFNRVRISEHGGWRHTHTATLGQHYGAAAISGIPQELLRPYRLLVGLNLALLRIVLERLEVAAAWHFQSHLDGGRSVSANSNDPTALAPISARLAMMVAELGGDSYLSGPSGRGYLDERPFRERGVAVDYFAWRDANPCALDLISMPIPRAAEVAA